MKEIKFDYSQVEKFVTKKEIEDILPGIKHAKNILDSKTGDGNTYLGWLDLPVSISDSELQRIEKAAERIKKSSDILIVVGIGGSYLGARAAIEAIRGTYANEMALLSGNGTAVYFSGCNMSSDNLASLLELIKGKRVFVNVISKSGTTTEPAIALRVIYEALKKEIGEEEAKKRFIATTDKSKGALKTLADKEGWETFVVPDDVGGRYSVMTAVGLLPIAVAGIDIRQLLEGAKNARANALEEDLSKNVACMYAAVRNILYSKGRKIELLSNFELGLHYFGEWWKQLFGESEGKENKGIYPDSLDFSTDLHSMGQYIQEGERMLMETFLNIQNSRNEILVPHSEDDLDGLNYLEGKTLQYVNRTALRGTSTAHSDGNVPNMEFLIPLMDEYFLGWLFYMFEYACGVSGYYLKVNPFNQPGVEAYKKNMFALLGKPSKK